VLTAVNTIVLAPIPRPSEHTTVSRNNGFHRSSRAACRTSSRFTSSSNGTTVRRGAILCLLDTTERALRGAPGFLFGHTTARKLVFE
jgi:hypothetical protein